MKILKKIAIGFAALVTIFVVGSYLIPSDWRVERSIVIGAPAEKIYPWLINFRTGWPQWCAFDAEDPEIYYSYKGPDEGLGAIREWKSKKMGNGIQKVTKADPATGAEFDMEMVDTNFKIKIQFIFEAMEGGTRVTWIDTGTNGLNPVYRWMSLFLDKMMGPYFERSLEKLKSLAEG